MWRGRFVQQHQGAIEILVLSLLGFSFLSFERNVFPGKEMYFLGMSGVLAFPQSNMITESTLIVILFEEKHVLM